MSLSAILAVLVTLSAIFSYINHRFIRLPTPIGLMLIALLMSLGLIALGYMGFDLAPRAKVLLENINFNETLLHGMLSFLLFAGALHVNINDLARHKWVIASLATVGIIISTLIVGFVSHWMLARFGIDMPILYCMLFGALISPTDPIAVLSILKSAGVSKSLETKITGESLFNDGVAVVVFITLLGILTGEHETTFISVTELLLIEIVGGIVYGLAIGALAYWMLKSIDNYQVEILITLALVTGGYTFAHVIHVSGPIAIVVAGLLIGNQGRYLAMSDKTTEHLDMFWELVDEILNAVLFVLIGLEILILTITPQYLFVGVFMIPMVLLARLISVGLPISVLKMRREFSPHVIKIMTWGGLRGGISIALALALPAGPEREVIVTITYIIVVFSILVQGLTIGKLVKASKE